MSAVTNAGNFSTNANATNPKRRTTMNTPTPQEKALARRGEANTGTLIDALRKNKESIARYFRGDRDEADRLIRVAYDACTRNAQLLKCSTDSIVLGVKRAASLCLDLSPELGQAALVPRWNGRTKRMEASLEIEYRGYIELASRSGLVKAIRADVVYDCDRIEYENGLNPVLRHVPNLDRVIASQLRAAYAVADMADGGQAHVLLTKADVEKRRDASPSWQAKEAGKIKETTWDTHPEAMWRKSAIRALASFLPKSIAPEMLKASGIEQAEERGIDLEASIIEEPRETVDAETGEVSPDREPGQEG
jgi:recombination protein RecT